MFKPKLIIFKPHARIVCFNGFAMIKYGNESLPTALPINHLLLFSLEMFNFG
jgi:hypothetical protein